MAVADETVPFGVKNSALFNEPAPPVPPVTRMRPSASKAAAEFVLACDRLTADVHAPITVDGKVALRIPAEEISARRTHRSLGARFIAMPRKIDMDRRESEQPGDC